MRNNKIRIFCDIDDTLWDLLPHWIEHNNILYDAQSTFVPLTSNPKIKYRTPVQKLSTDLNIYDDWNLRKYFLKEEYADTFFSLLTDNELWGTLRAPTIRVDTLKKINEHKNIDISFFVDNFVLNIVSD